MNERYRCKTTSQVGEVGFIVQDAAQDAGVVAFLFGIEIFLT